MRENLSGEETERTENKTCVAMDIFSIWSSTAVVAHLSLSLFLALVERES